MRTLFRNPVEVLSGEGARAGLRELLPDGPALLVTSEGMVRRGAAKELMTFCPGREWVVRTVSSNPDLDALDAMEVPPVASVVALGGGSAMDAGKALAARLANPGATLDGWLRGRCPERAAMLPLFCLPTTSGTGAEVTPFATIWDNRDGVKRSLAGPFLYPRTALLDPELCTGVPWRTTLFCGLDTVSHALETLWNRNATPVGVALANGSLRLAVGALPELEGRPSDVALRGTMQTASLLAGLAISQNRTAVAHAMSYPFTLGFGVPHGLACSFTLRAIGTRVTAARAWADGTDAACVERAFAMIGAFRLPEVMAGYCTAEQALPHVGEMFVPGRTGNFVLDVDRRLVEALVKESLEE